MKLIFCLSLLMTLLSSMPVLAQQTVQDLIYMKDGTLLEGIILNYESGEMLRLQKEDGSVQEIRDTDIAKILQGIMGLTKDANPKLTDLTGKQVFQLHSQGWYNTLYVGFGFGKAEGEGSTISAGFSNVLGYQWSPKLGAGVGIGLDNYTRRGETVFPVFTEVRNFLSIGKTKYSYFISAAGGYSFAFKRANIELLEANGGWMVHPAFGFRTATRAGTELLVDFGIKFQKALFVRLLDNGDRETRDLVFRRFTIRIAISLWK